MVYNSAFSRAGWTAVTLANRITIFRLVLVPVFCGLMFAYTVDRPMLRVAALVLYIVAALSDALDGYVARRYNQVSHLGRRLDPLADKLLVNLGLVFMAANPQFHPTVPLWFPAAILSRDVLIVLGAFTINERYGPVRVRPRPSGKVTTALQMTTMVVLLMALPGAEWLLWATLLFSAWSLVDYLLFGWTQVTEKETTR